MRWEQPMARTEPDRTDDDAVVVAHVRSLERAHLGGRRHVFESRMKEQRRTQGRPGHESRPPSAHTPEVDLTGDR
ncbi:MAG: hypothetical protein R2713_08290 [Ilumatobacteraceae bacterium]